MSCNECLSPITKCREPSKTAIAANPGSLTKSPAPYPISAISAVAIALHAANKLYSLVEGIQDCPREIQTVSTDSKCVCDTLNNLKRFLEESKCDLPTEILQSLHIPLDNTQAVLEVLHVKLKPFVTSNGEVKTSKLGAIRWAFNQKEVKQLGEQLSNGKSTLNMTLAVFSVITTADIKNDTSEILDYLSRLKLDQRPGQEKPEGYIGADEADLQQSDPRMQKFNFVMTRFLETASTTVHSPPQSPWAPPTNAAQASIHEDDLEDEDDLYLVNAPGLTQEDGEAEIHDILATKPAAFLNNDGQSALHLAAMLDEYMTGDVLRHGVDIDIRNLDGETPLMCAVRMDKKEVVTLLLKNNANANVGASEGGGTCLHLATAKDKTGIITRLLLKRGADLEAMDEMGLTPLSAAAFHGNDVVARILVEQGGHLEASGALHYATMHGNHAFMARLLSPGGPDFEAFYEVSSYGLSPLPGQDTTAKRRISLVHMLLDYGADIHARNNEGFTPLQIAAVAAQGPLVELLLEQGATAEGVTVVCAYWGLSTSIVKSLVEKGANIHATDSRWNKPALTWEAELGSPATIKVLLEHGADVHHHDEHGSALLYASGNARVEVVKLLLEAGADPNQLSHQNKTSLLGLASGLERYFLAGKWWEPSAADRTATVTLLLDAEKRCDPDAKDMYGRAAIHYAASNGWLGVVEVIVDKGGDWQIEDEKGLTPRERAQERGRLDVVRFLKRKALTREKARDEPVCVTGAPKEESET